MNRILIDWLELLDPELVAMVPDLQHQLLFARKAGHTGSQGGEKNQAYLLALLTHQSSWTTLHRCINTLLHDNNK